MYKPVEEKGRVDLYSKNRVLIIDDDPDICNVLREIIHEMGHRCDLAHSLKEGLYRAKVEEFDVILLDLRLPDGNGIDILPELRSTPSNPEVIIITGYGDPDGAELAIKSGIWDYIQKPFSLKTISLSLKRVFQHRNEIKKHSFIKRQLRSEGIIGSSPQIKACIDLLAQAAERDSNVLIMGETGTGKELFARAIHINSLRGDNNFIVVDCAALPESLVESIIFGHEKGAFTGADNAKAGLIKQADKGTLFLDEIGELSPKIQKKFLRVLEYKKFRAIGGETELESDFRLISATNRDLDEMVEKGEFRKDLLFRLRVFTIRLPALREHREDILEISKYHLKRLCQREKIPQKELSTDVIDIMMQYNWPGNVRELINALETAIVNSKYESTIYPKHLPQHIRSYVLRKNIGMDNLKKLPPYKQYKKNIIYDATKRYLIDLISQSGGDLQKACNISGLSKSRLYELLRLHNIKFCLLYTSPSPRD